MRDEIEDLYATYCHALDDGDASAWASVFTVDGEFIGPGRPSVVGRDALRQFVRDRDAVGMLHNTFNIRVVDAGDGEVRVDADFVILVAEPSGRGASVSAMGRYRDCLRQEDGRLRIGSRHVTRIV